MFTFTPKHQKLVNDCYKESLDTQKLSILIHHISLKPERMNKITKYLRQKIKKESKSQSIEITCTITLQIMHNFDYQSSYESNILKIVNTGIKYTIKNGITKYDTLLHILKEFKNGMRTYSGEKEVSKIINVVTNALNQTKASLCESDESSSVLNEYRYDLTNFFFDILNLVIGISEVFNTDFENKYQSTLQAICRFENEKCLAMLCKTVNIITIRSFARLLVKMAAENGFDCVNIVIEQLETEFLIFIIVESNYYLVERVKCLWEIIDLENKKTTKEKQRIEDDSKDFKNDKMRNSDKLSDSTKSRNTRDRKNKESSDKIRQDTDDNITYDPLHDNSSEISTYITSPLSVSYVCMNQDKKLKCQKRIIYLPKILKEIENKYHDIFLVFKWNYMLMDLEITNQNVLEVSQSFFYLLKNVCKQNTRIKKDDVKEVTNELEDTSLSEKSNFILSYLQTYLEKSESRTDILYLFLKKTFQFETNAIDDRVTIYTLSFQNIVLRVTMKCAPSQMQLDPKFIALLFRISENVHFRDTCYHILIRLKNKELSGDDRKAVLFKVRSLYFQNHNMSLLKILLDMVIKYKMKENELTMFIIIHVHKEIGKLDYIYDFCMKNGMENLYKNYVGKEIDYNYEKDVRFYNEVMGSSFRMYSHSIKSTINLENLKSKRKSLLTKIKFFN